MGVGGADSSAEASTSPPRASSNSACLVFLDPNFIPEPLNAGARVVEEAGETEVVMRGVDDDGVSASYRGTAE